MHGEIEERYFYPRLRDEFQDGDELADEAINEHLEMKQTLDGIDSMTAEHDGFASRMRTLVRDVRHHVRAEESDLFPRAQQPTAPDPPRWA